MPKLVIVGSGINAAEHITVAARDWIKKADHVLYLVGDPFAEKIILELKPEAESLLGLYDESMDRNMSYQLMVTLMIGYLHQHDTVCVVFYGHPSVFVNPAPMAIKQARQMGFEAVILPGISAEDCLFADLSIDPAFRGCQSYEATDFLTRRRIFDPTAGLVLWQIDGLATRTAECMTDGFVPKHLDVLTEVLIEAYSPDHPAIIYEAATLSDAKPRMDRIRLVDLPNCKPTGASTMYVPPRGKIVHDEAMLKRLGIVQS